VKDHVVAAGECLDIGRLGESPITIGLVLVYNVEVLACAREHNQAREREVLEGPKSHFRFLLFNY